MISRSRGTGHPPRLAMGREKAGKRVCPGPIQVESGWEVVIGVSAKWSVPHSAWVAARASPTGW